MSAKLRALTLAMFCVACASVGARPQDGCAQTDILTSGAGQKVIVPAPAAGQLVICQGAVSTTASTTLTLDWSGSKLPLRAGDGYAPLPHDTLPPQTAFSFSVSASASIRGFVRTKVINVPSPTPTPTPTPTPSPTPTPTPTPLPSGVFTAANLRLLGALRLASGPCAGDLCSVNWGGSTLTYEPSGDGGNGSLLVAGFPTNDGVAAEFGGLDTALAAMTLTQSYSQTPVLTKLAGWSLPLTAGDAVKVSPGATVRLGGLLKREDGRLLVNVYTYFGAASTFTSIFTANGNLATPGTLSGPFEIPGAGGLPPFCASSTNCRESWTSGHLTRIPAAFQPLFGGADTLASGGNYSIIGRTSSGASATVLKRADIGVLFPIPAKRVLGYPTTQTTLGNWDATFAGTGQWTAAPNEFAFPPILVPGFDSVLFAGVLGIQAHFCYGPPTGALDALGNPFHPISPAYATGTNASTDAAGTRVTLPGANLANLPTGSNWPQGSKGHGLWLTAQTTPLWPEHGRIYTASPRVLDKGDSGLATAWVTVSAAFAPNLTNQAYVLGERSCYDPMQQGSTSPNPVKMHTPSNYPYQAVLFAYKASDLGAVYAGTLNYWQPVPYAVLPLPMPFTFPAAPATKLSLGGATYDDRRDLVYVLQRDADAGGSVTLNVYQVVR